MSGKKGAKHLNTKEKNKILRYLSLYPITDVQKLTGRNFETIQKVQKENIQRIELQKQRIAEKCLDVSEMALQNVTKKKLQETSAHSLVSTAREATYTHFLSKEGISPDAKQQTTIVGIQFAFQNPANKTSPVLGGFKDSKVVEAEEVKPEEKKEDVNP